MKNTGKIAIFIFKIDFPLSDDIFFYKRFLSDKEKESVFQYQSVEDQKTALLSKLAARASATYFVSGRIDPIEWDFDVTRLGKPHLSCPDNTSLNISISHTKTILAIGITQIGDIGIDVEDYLLDILWKRIARRFFPKIEYEYLSNLNNKNGSFEFLRLWTAKEALAKASQINLVKVLGKILIKQNQLKKIYLPNELDLIPWRIQWIDFDNSLLAICYNSNSSKINFQIYHKPWSWIAESLSYSNLSLAGNTCKRQYADFIN